jgi:uncharacterized protein YhbP (UPF0306 family)
VATTITRYVNPGSVGGDGTTPNLTGATAAYASLAAGLTAQVRGLVAADEIARFVCAGTVADTAVPGFSSSWICDATRYILIEGEAHGGSYNTNAYRLEYTVASGTIGSNLPATNLFKVIWRNVQFKITTNNGTGVSSVFRAQSGMQAGSVWEMEKCLAKWVQGGSYTGQIRFLRAEDADCAMRVRNCQFYDWNSNTTSEIYDNNINNNVYFYNCGFFNNGRAINNGSGTSIRVRNCIFKGNNTDIAGTMNSASNYNHSDKASGMPGANSTHSNTFTFVNEGADNYHLASSDTGAIDKGEDLSADANFTTTFSDDIDGATRSGTWDAGADEFSGAPTAAPGAGLLVATGLAPTATGNPIVGGSKLFGKLGGKLIGKV